MATRRVYISGPIDGLNKEERRAAFKEVQLKLEAAGFETFNPMENGLPEDAPTSRHMRRDLAELTNEDHPYDTIFMMKRWTHSKGCKTEFDNATAMALDFIFEDAIDRFGWENINVIDFKFQ